MSSTRRPWSPIPLILVALVGGLPGAGALLGINWYRLGRPEEGRRTILLFAILTLVGATVLGWLNSRGQVGGVSPDSAGEGAGVLVAWQFGQIGIAAVEALRQRGPFERFLAEENSPAGLGGFLAETVVAMAFAAIGGALIHGAIVRLAVRIFSGS